MEAHPINLLGVEVMATTCARFLLLGILCGTSLFAQPVRLLFKPVDIQYSKSLDRLVMLSANPNQVHLVNPANGAETTINLSLTPLSLSVSPDGSHAAVGHDGWISYVNLASGYVEKNLAVSVTASSVLLAGNGVIWVPPTTNVNVATGIQTSSGYSAWSVVQPALHPNGNWVYYTRGGSPDDVVKGDMSGGSFVYLYDSRYHGDFPICGGVFYSAGGDRLLTGCATLFRTTASTADDITYNGALSATQWVTAAVDSATTGKFIVIPGNGYFSSPANNDTELQFYDDVYLTLLGRVALPKYTSGVSATPWHGRKIYYSPDASKVYVVLQADSAANLTNDYAIYSLTLSTGSGCAPSLGANSGNVVAAGGSVDVSVTATAGCLWQASSNATWLSVGAGGVSSGSGTVTILASPNLQTVSRTGTVTIAGLTYTVTQNAAAAVGSNPVTQSPVRPIAAGFSAPLDRMILVSTNPDLLTILDPVTGSGQTVPLSLPPTSLSIAPDGLRAAVGHDGRISYVNLTTPSVEKILPVTTTVYDLALSAKDIFAFPLRDQWEAIRVVNIATGVETLWNWIYAGTAAGKISPNGKYLYINAGKRYDVTQPLPSAFDATIGSNPKQWFSQDGSRLFSGSGQAYLLSDVVAQDLQYNGTLESSGLTAVADSSVQQVTATVATGTTSDTAIKFFSQQYHAVLGSLSIPKFAVGQNSYDAHGRYLFWNAAGNRLFALVQADQTSGLLYDFAIYSVSFNGGCNTSLQSPSASAPAIGGSNTVGVTANTGCAWKATSSAPWLTISTNAFSAGSATIGYIVDANPTTASRTATITVDGKTFTVTQAAGTQVQLSSVNNVLFRVVDAEYSSALDRIAAISGSPSRLNIYNPATGANTAVALPLPGNAVSIEPTGIRAAVCHDGQVSVVNLQTATLEKTVNVSVNCHDIVYAGNDYVYMSVTGGWGTLSSVNLTTRVETKADLLYNGTNFRLNATGDAIYTSDTGTSGLEVTRYSIAAGPMKYEYQSDIYPAHAYGYKVWFTADGRMAGDSGSVFRTGSTLATDFIYTGTLSGVSGSQGQIVSLAHSPSRHLFASIGPSTGSSTTSATGDQTLFLHGDKYLALTSKLTLPKITIGGVSAASHGKFVFWDSTGSKAYVVLQADSSAGFLNDFAVYTLSPEFTAGCAVTLGTISAAATAYADTGAAAVSAAADCVWEVKSNASWIQIDSGTLGIGTGNVSYSVYANPTTSARTGTITIGTQTLTVTQAAGSQTTGPQALRFVPLAPCRMADTRLATGPFGGPAIAGGTNRAFTLPSSGCGIPPNAQAYSLNVTVVPHGPLSYLTIWPTGQSQPFVSTLNSFDGRIKANAAIVPAGNGGAVSVFVTDTTDVILDVNGYFVPATTGTGTGFYPVTPCRITDTRGATGSFGGPSMTAGQTRSFAVPSSNCGIPATAQAYSLNFTVVPKGPLSYLTTWPAGTAQPVVSTLNAPTGTVVANAAIVPAGANGAINVYSTDRTDLIIDINGYFADPAGAGALAFYTATPCRISDTRLASGTFGGPTLASAATRSYAVAQSACSIPATAQAYSLNATVVPPGMLGYLTMWPAGRAQPTVSTLNSWDATVVANAAIVPAGTGGISVYVSDRTELILDISGYFAP